MNRELSKPLIFSATADRGKPTHMNENNNGCPFCNYSEEENILKKEGEFTWIKNKFRTLENTFQTIIIEGENHNGELSKYSKEYFRSLMTFAFNCWDEMKNDKNYQSVLFYKNHGPLSGGTLIHPHMQIVGLKEQDGESKLDWRHLDGVPVFSNDYVTITFSTFPVMGFLEINIKAMVNQAESVDHLADTIQSAVRYLMRDERCNSYNLFFYEKEGRIIAKVTPRYITSPYYVGYRLSQTFSENHLIELGKEFINYLAQ